MGLEAYKPVRKLPIITDLAAANEPIPGKVYRIGKLSGTKDVDGATASWEQVDTILIGPSVPGVATDIEPRPIIRLLYGG